MRQWRLAVLMMLVLPLLAGFDRRIQLPGIIGHDDRVILDTDDWPWLAIGRVNRTTGGFCTGALVASNVVLTAAHCLYHPITGRPLPAEGLHFLTGYRRGEYRAHSIARAVVHPQTEHVGQHGQSNHPGSDWALIVLQDAPGVKPVEVRALSPPELAKIADGPLPVLHVGYGQDHPHLLSLHNGCHITGYGKEGRVLIHDCDSPSGGSGSPLILKEKDGFSIIGLTIGVVRQREQDFGLAVGASSFLEALGRLTRGEAVKP